ncbi:MAG: SAM-dependent chlorinase/fluorinase [Desulfobacterales bacterium]|nr:SAM-dependent chlorinase/fluorinase [Desulfobacterales bacterium]
MAVVTLITDFGTRDAYVGVMKGAILSVDPRAVIVDITHGVPPQDLACSARELADAFTYFPPETVHVTVVDPGVGSGRRILAVAAAGQLFLAPDNGILPASLAGVGVDAAVSVENRSLFRQPVSPTFHGRDIFAPVAGHLSLGLALGSLGPAVAWHDLVRLTISGPRPTPGGGLTGTIIAVDRFGNLITDICRSDLERLAGRKSWQRLTVRLGTEEIHGIAGIYADGVSQKPIALLGSRGRLEVAVRDGSAVVRFSARRGDPVYISTR